MPRSSWMDYLRWYRETLGLAVENDTEVVDIRPGEGVVAVDTVREGRTQTRLAQVVVLASGFVGGGRWRVPDFISASLVNNAGMQFRSPLEDLPVEKWEQLLANNISSAFYVGQAVARHMIPRGHGKIINVSELARPGIAPYTATKGAVKNLTRGMCADWAKYGL